MIGLARTWALSALTGLVLALTAVGPSAAQGLLSFGDSEQPLEITADDGIEWRRKEQLYIASGNARAARGDLVLFADILAAYYREGEDGGTEIYRVEAHGQVRVVSPNETISGNDGYYDVERGVVVLTGDDLRLEAGGDILTAKDSLEYWETEQLAVARGKAEVIRDDNRLTADILVGHFATNVEGKLTLSRVDAKGDVRISTPTDFVRSDSGVYYLDKELAELIGAVKITRGHRRKPSARRASGRRGGYAGARLVHPGAKRLRRRLVSLTTDWTRQ